MIASRETLDLGALKSSASQSDRRFALRVSARYRSSAVGKLWKDVGIVILRVVVISVARTSLAALGCRFVVLDGLGELELGLAWDT